MKWLGGLAVLIVVLPSPVLSNESLEAYDSKLEELVYPFVARNDFMGVIGVKAGDREPRIHTFGFSNIQEGIAHHSATEFMAGSITKQFTAAAILLLEEDGRLQTSDPVAKHLEQVARGQDITIEQLLTHTAGIVDVFALNSFAASGGVGGQFADVVEEIARAPLIHEPGERFLYSNGGYLLLAAIIERVSGQPYGRFLEDRIFRPLKMTRTHNGNDHGADHRPANGYHPTGGDGLTTYPPQSVAYTIGAGSIWSTATDLIAWSEGLHNGEVLTPQSYAKLTHDYGHGYGYGVSVFERFGQPVIGHDGRLSGFAADLAWYVDDRASVVVLSNVESVAKDQVRAAAAAALLAKPFSAARPPRFATTGPALEGLEGAYSFGPGLTVFVRNAAGRLLAKANYGSESELIYTEDGSWFSRMLYTRVCFDGGASGRAASLSWGCADNSPLGPRIEN